MRERIKIKIYQQDWIPGFAAFASDGTLSKQAEPHAEILLNIGETLLNIKEDNIKKEDMPYHIMTDIMHELTHVLEEWCGVEFCEEKVEKLIEEYDKKYSVMPK